MQLLQLHIHVLPRYRGPGLQVKPWPCMKALKVTYTHGNASPSTYLTSFAVNSESDELVAVQG